MKRYLESIHIPNEKKTGASLIMLSLAFGAVAQLMLILSASDNVGYWNIATWLSSVGDNASPLSGLLLYIIAGTLLVLGLRQLDLGHLPSLNIFTQLSEKTTPRFGFWLTSTGLAWLVAFYTSRPQKAFENGYALASLWILSIGLFSYSVLRQSGWKPPSIRAIIVWIKDNRFEVSAVALLVVLAFLVRTFALELHPYSMVNDEGEMGKGALCLLRGECPNIFSLAWASQPLVAYTPYAISVALFGNHAAYPVRLVSVVTGVLAVLFTYLFVRETFDKKTALIAGLLLVVFPYHVHFSRLGVDNIVDSLSTSLLLWLIFRGLRKGSAATFLLAGIITGLCFYTYPGSRLAAALGIGALGYAILTRRGLLRAQVTNLLVFAVAAAITAAPIYGTYQVSNDEFNARFTSVGILQNGELEKEIQNTGLSAVQILTRQFLKSSLAFISTPAPINFFNSPRPYLSALASILLMLGLALAFWKMLDLRHITLLAWFFLPIILGSTLTAGAPTSQRMLGSIPATIILVTITLVTLIQALEGFNSLLRRLALSLLVISVLFIGYQDLSYYFGEYRTGFYFGDLSNEITYESRATISELEGNGRLYLIGDPMTYVIFGNFDFLNPGIEKYDFNEITPEAIAALPKDQNALFLAIPYREADLRLIADWLPGGQWIAENRRFQPQQPLFFAYKVSKEQLQAFQP